MIIYLIFLIPSAFLAQKRFVFFFLEKMSETEQKEQQQQEQNQRLISNLENQPTKAEWRAAVGQNTAASPGSLASYETVKKDGGVDTNTCNWSFYLIRR